MVDTSVTERLFAAWPEFGGLAPAVAERLAACCREVSFEAADTVFTMGQEDGSTLYLVAGGQGRLTRADGERGDICVEEVTAGSAVGLAAFARRDDSLSVAALQATDALSLIEVDAHALRALCEEEASLALSLLALLARKTAAARRQDDPRARVFRHLLSLVRQDSEGRTIPEMPRHAALAEAAGVSDVEAAGAVADLIARGIARRAYPGLVVLDSDELHRSAFA